MKNFFKIRNKKEKQVVNKPKFTKTIINVFLLFSILFIFISVPLKPVQAASPFVAAINLEKNIWDKVKTAANFLWKKSGAIAYHQTLSLVLNKIAYDAANYVGAGAYGQKPTYLTKNLGDYLKDVGDQAAGQFIESFVNHLNDPESGDCMTNFDNCTSSCFGKYGFGEGADNTKLTTCTENCKKANTACISRDNASTTASYMAATPSFNICGASSLQAKLKIGLGLTNVNRPKAPNCSYSKMVKSWKEDYTKKYENLQDKDFLTNFASYFDPRSNDLGIYMLAKSDMSSKALVDTENQKSAFVANKGFKELVNIGGEKTSPPGTAERRLEEASAVKDANLGKMTENVFVDAANLFLNQVAMSLYNETIKHLTENNDEVNQNINFRNSYDSAPNSGLGATSLKKTTAILLKPIFGSLADYDILSSLSICIDPENPAPDHCVIDNQFSQAIAQKETVAEALAKGYLHGNWQVTNSTAGDAYNSNYSLRNIAILIKYRILPIAWQEAAQKIINNSGHPGTTLNDLVSCFDPNDNYTKFSNGFNQNEQGWCQGLVDPNWVLKAPLNYCKKSGYGAQILNIRKVEGIAANGNIPATTSSVDITRADDYCADKQSCIKENNNGSCDAYGYCTGEKRIWKFNTDSCQPINNTCQTFSGPEGQTVSYLQNTLDYKTCNSENFGCRQYSFFGNYSTSTKKISWDQNSSLYLNNNLKTCSNQDNACQGLLRVKPNWGNNLVMNSDFSNDELGASSTGNMLNNWPLVGDSIQASIVDSSQDPGQLLGKALKLEISKDEVSGLESSFTRSLLPANLQIIPGRAYTLSADVYIQGGSNLGTKVSLSLGEDADIKTASTTDTWQHLTITRLADTSYNDPNFKILGQNPVTNGIFYLKNIKFEMSDWNTDYSVYGYTPKASAEIHEKLLPKYLESTCYVKPYGPKKDYSLKTDAPQICSDYARKCSLTEVGCNSYTNSVDNYTVNAQVNTSDYCPEECVGYDVYTTQGTYFNSPTRENLIPSTAVTCSAAALGCNEFTNLDTLNQGGEQKEYYTSLKQCIKPSTAQCASFYSWQGQGDGYQLQAYSLKKDINGLPALTSNDESLCNAQIYNLPISDPAFNPDCRQFYNISGVVSYHLISHTITCSDNCHAYRMTAKNIDQNIKNAFDCNELDGYWNIGTKTCNLCLNGGIWDDTSKACIYQAIPGEGQICSASQNGCREYDGNQGSNIRIVFYDDFEGGLDNWSSACDTGFSSISLSSVASNKNGHSLSSKTECSKTYEEISQLFNIPACQAQGQKFAATELNLDNLIEPNSAYTLKFLARASSDANLTIYFLNEDTQTISDAFAPVVLRGGNEWQLYQTNLTELKQNVGDNEKLVIISDSDFYLDDFILSSISDRYYLIDQSSKIPNSCYFDVLGVYQGDDYNLGCSVYTDRSGDKVNLHKFSGLCSASAVGCEQMIDTQNYYPAGPGFWENGKATSTCSSSDANCVHVPGDSAFYAVYDPNKQCSAANQGCSLLGQGQGGASLSSWRDVYKLNNPDNYNKTLCSQENLGCEAWWNKTDNTTSYFKDPGNNVCEYRLGNNSTSNQAWYKIPAKRCDLDENGEIDGSESNDNICLNDDDCSNGKCILDNNDYPCSVSFFKTIGLGGSGNEVPVPNSSVGLCFSNEAGCSEYIDPVSKFNPNLIKNPNYIKNKDGSVDGWGPSVINTWHPKATETQQVIPLKQYQLYSLNLSSENGQGVSIESNPNYPLWQLLNNNTFASSSLILTGTSTQNMPIIFNSGKSTKVLLSGGDSDQTIELKELAVSYQLQKNIDKTTCAGQVQFNNACILFNERTVSGASGLASLPYDAYQTNNTSSTNPVPPLSCNNGSCTANQIIKVRPDRICSQWLACDSYGEDSETGEKTCYSFGECNRLNNNNECANWLENKNNSTSSLITNANASGYNILNDYDLSQMKIVGNEINDTAYDFENHSLPTCKKNSISNEVCLIDNPDIAESAVQYPVQGRAYLSIPANSSWSTGEKYFGAFAVSFINTNNDNLDYNLNYLVNTERLVDAKAKITIKVNYDEGVSSTSEFTIPAGLAWTREVNKFSVGKKANSVIITLGTSVKEAGDKSHGQVFFDDLKISPVLEVAPDKYVVPECRLYPTSDSLTCLNANSNTVKPGLEGYCLEHDPANPGVCLLWYPLDNIPTPSLSAIGYQGKFPLNYCSAVNGNFELLENRKAFWIKERQIDKSNIKLVKGGEYQIDKKSSEGCYKFDGNHYPLAYCNAEGDNELISKDYVLWVSNKKCGSGCKDYRKYICVPIDGSDSLIPQMRQTMSKSLHPDYDNHDWEKCSDDMFTNGYGIYNGLSNHEDTNMSPPVAVYDYNNPVSSDLNLKYPYAINGMSDDKIFKLTCNSFVQVADANNVNKAWVGRIKNTNYALATPFFFNPYNQPPYSIDAYGQSRFEAPFGSASSPHNNLFTSGLIALNDSLTKAGSNLAGRPYSCQAEENNNGCNSIGYCQNAPDTYCLTGANLEVENNTGFKLAKQSCGSVGGDCLPLWGKDQMIDNGLAISSESTNVLKNIFLSGKLYKYNKPTLSYFSSSDDNYNFSNYGPNPIDPCTNNIRSNPNDFCAVYPRVFNAKLYYNDELVNDDSNITVNTLLNITKGWNRLEFNSHVDSEQQPLHNINIDWGDGSFQTIINQDNHPASSSPHIFYHNYSNNISENRIIITVVDNWGFYGQNENATCTPNNNQCAGADDGCGGVVASNGNNDVCEPGETKTCNEFYNTSSGWSGTAICSSDCSGFVNLNCTCVPEMPCSDYPGHDCGTDSCGIACGGQCYSGYYCDSRHFCREKIIESPD